MSVALAKHGSVAVLTLVHAPVNALSFALRRRLMDKLSMVLADPSVGSVVLVGDGCNFSSGADISEFSGADALNNRPFLNDILPVIESATKPVVAAIDGVAFGGGFELCLACHYRVGTTRAKVGLPEVNLGIIPGSGGTQRLPRLAGVETALKMVVSGSPLTASKARDLGILDVVFEAALGYEGLVADAVAFAAARFSAELDSRRLSLRPVPLPSGTTKQQALDACSAAAAALPEDSQGGQAMRAGARAVAAAVRLCPEVPGAAASDVARALAEGLDVEAELFAHLVVSPQAAARQHLFFAEKAAGKLPGVAPAAWPASGLEVGIVGGGTMGAGIAIAALAAPGVSRVVVVDSSAERVEWARAYIARGLASLAKRGRLSPALAFTPDAVAARLDLGLGLAGLAGSDVVVEAVFEKLQLKRDVFAQLAATCKSGAVLATNTSTLDVDAIAEAAGPGRRGSCVGMHFFAPVQFLPPFGFLPRFLKSHLLGL